MADINSIICKEKVNETDDSVVLQRRGADGINAGDNVHVKCRKRYVDKKDIVSQPKKVEKIIFQASENVVGSPNSIKIFVYSVILLLNSPLPNITPVIVKRRRSGQQENAAQIEMMIGVLQFLERSSITRSLHATDCVYHRSCNTNFRTDKQFPSQYGNVSNESIERST